MENFTQVFAPLELDSIHEFAAKRKEEGWRYVQILAVNTEDGIDLIYSFMKDGALTNHYLSNIARDTHIPSISDLFLEAFVCENEIHDLYGLAIDNMAIDFGGNFYQLATKEPMTIISPEQKAAREKARKIAAAKAKKAAANEETKASRASAANAEFISKHPDSTEKSDKPTKIIEPSGKDDLDAKLAGMDPEKVARVKAAMAAKAKKAAQEKGE